MATQGSIATEGGKADVGGNGDPRSLAISERGIKTGSDFAGLMSALMTDIIAGRITPSVGNAACNAGGKLLKIVEMQYRYGVGSQGERVLTLAPEAPAPAPPQITAEAAEQAPRFARAQENPT